MKPLTVAAAGLAVAHAFVVVPEIAQADSDIVKALPFEAPFTADTQSLKLSCPGCPMYWGSHASGKAKTNIPNHLELAFVIDHESDVDRLMLNGFELYPNADPWHGALTAPQVMDIMDIAMKHPRKGRPHRAKLGYSLAIHPVVKEEEGQQLELVEVELQIIEVGRDFVDGIPAVKVNLVKTPSGKLMIAGVDTIEAVKTEPAKAVADCKTMLCKWQAMINEFTGFKGFKHCGKGMKHGHHKGHHKSHPKQSADGARRIVHHHHTWKQLFKNISTYILLPVLVGIVAGVSISILGMLVGTFAVFMWRVFVRRQSPFRRHCRRRGHSCHKINVAEVAPVEEKSGLMEHQDPPPEYEAADATEEAPLNKD